jgi:hypothetical protein
MSPRFFLFGGVAHIHRNRGPLHTGISGPIAPESADFVEVCRMDSEGFAASLDQIPSLRNRRSSFRLSSFIFFGRLKRTPRLWVPACPARLLLSNPRESKITPILAQPLEKLKLAAFTVLDSLHRLPA